MKYSWLKKKTAYKLNINYLFLAILTENVTYFYIKKTLMFYQCVRYKGTLSNL